MQQDDLPVPRPQLQKPYGTVTDQPGMVATVAATTDLCATATENAPAYGAVQHRSPYPSRIGSHSTVFSPWPAASPSTRRPKHPHEEVVSTADAAPVVYAIGLKVTATTTAVAHVTEPSPIALLPPAPPPIGSCTTLAEVLESDDTESDNEGGCEEVAIVVEELQSSKEVGGGTGANAGPRMDLHIRGYDDHAVSTDNEPWSVL